MHGINHLFEASQHKPFPARILLRRAAGVVVTLAICMSAVADNTLADHAQQVLSKSCTYFHSISTNGGYAGIYSPDLKQRFGEAVYEKAKDTEIWVQPPGTPSVGAAYLRAYEVTGDEQYLTYAIDAGRALAWGQRSMGGWNHRVDVAHLDKDTEEVVRHDGHCTFDDDITQGALKFLMELDGTVDEPWLTQSIELGLDFMLASQFDNGGWPQWYPLRGGYHDYFTFNDNSINDCIAVMMEAHRRYHDARYLASARRGGDFIVLSQLDAPQAGWAQQFNHDLEPAWARSFEPPGVCSAATARNIRTLVDLYIYTWDDDYLAPIPAAIDWLQRSPIAEGTWARLYEVGTNKPIYGDREDGDKVHYDYASISEKERTSYGWQGAMGVEGAIAYYEQVRSKGAEAITATRQEAMENRARDPKRYAPAAKAAIEALDEEGRWIENEQITSRKFVSNALAIIYYLEALKDSQ